MCIHAQEKNGSPSRASAFATASVTILPAEGISHSSDMEFREVQGSCTGSIKLCTSSDLQETGTICVNDDRKVKAAYFHIDQPEKYTYSIELPAFVKLQNSKGDEVFLDNFNLNLPPGNQLLSGSHDYQIRAAAAIPHENIHGGICGSFGVIIRYE